MSWRDLLQKPEQMFYPWTGERKLQVEGGRCWQIEGGLPPEIGWHCFSLLGSRKLQWVQVADSQIDLLQRHVVKGYLVGDRLLRDSVRVGPNPESLVPLSERVHLIEPGLDRFVRISAGRTWEKGPLIYRCQEMPLGPETDVLQAYLDKNSSVDHIPGVVPALDAAFQLETWQRALTEKRRRELEEQRRLEQERLLLEQRRKELVQKLGDGQGRREMARVNFAEAARAALVVGGAEYLDHRNAGRPHEIAVRFRLGRRRFECVCDDRTLQIVDAGICLTDHDTDEKGDTYFTLESLPAVIQQAEREHKLVVYRHV